MKRRLFIFTILIFFGLFFWIIFFGLKFDSFKLIFDYKGTTPVSPLYYLKRGREKVQSFFILADRDLVEWNFVLAEKRIFESQKLLNYGLYNLAKKQLDLAKNSYENGLVYLAPLIDVVDTNHLIEKKIKLKKLIENHYE
jgi:hypothetical protein